MPIEITPRARRQLSRLSHEGRHAITTKLEQLDADPAPLANMITQMVGKDNLFRLRVRIWRVVYRQSGDVIVVIEVATRERSYR